MATTNDAIRAGSVRVLRMMALLALVAGAATQSAWAIDVHAFGQQISIPQSAGAGTVLARYYISPRQACGQSSCSMTGVYNYPNGGLPAPGPTITTNVSGVSARLLINGQAYQTTSSFTPAIVFSQPLEVQLLSDGRPNAGGSLAGMQSAPYYFLVETKEVPLLKIMLSGTITPIPGTCSVSSQTVTLPRAGIHEFSNVGSTFAPTLFQIQINNCPPGYNRVGYTLEPVGGVIANAPGVLPLAGGSTVSGLKIRITDDSDRPATLGTSIKLNEYSKAKGGSFSIPMKASYIRTDAMTKPGAVKSTMAVLMDYQ